MHFQAPGFTRHLVYLLRQLLLCLKTGFLALTTIISYLLWKFWMAVWFTNGMEDNYSIWNLNSNGILPKEVFSNTWHVNRYIIYIVRLCCLSNAQSWQLMHRVISFFAHYFHLPIWPWGYMYFMYVIFYISW